MAQRRLKGIGSAETDATSIDLIDRFQLQNQSHSALYDVLVACEWFCTVAVRGLNGIGRGFVVISFCKPSAWIIKGGALPVASVEIKNERAPVVVLIDPDANNKRWTVSQTGDQ